MTDAHDPITLRILELSAIFADTPTFSRLSEQFLRLLARRRAEIKTGMIGEARAIAMIGASGSGKSRLATRLFQTCPGLLLARDGQERCDVISIMIPSPTTLKSVGRAILEALGRPLMRERTSDAIWELVRGFLKERQVLFLHLDEAQDIAQHQTPKEKQAVINTLKTLMQNKEWPVGLILSGMPGLRDIMNHDPQLARRVYPIELPRLSAIGDIEAVSDMIAYYAEATDLSCPSDRQAIIDTSARLIHAADREFGLAIVLTIESIEEALRGRSPILGREQFAAAFTRKTDCIAGLNPFIADDYELIDVRKILGREDEE